MTTKKQAYSDGYSTGYDILDANVNEIDASNFTQDDLDKLLSECQEYEADGYRQYSPFEFTAAEFNRSRDPDAIWGAYDSGVYAGMKAALRSFKAANRKGFHK